MKPSNAPLKSSICSMLFAAGSMQAATIAWTTSPGLDDLEVRTLGTQLFGYYWSASGGADPVIVNTVPFVLQTTIDAPVGLNFNGSYNNVEGIDLYQAPLTANNAGLSQILDGQNWGAETPLTLTGLTSGQQYLLQFMISDDRAGFLNARNYDVSDDNDLEGARDVERAYHSTRGGGVPAAAPPGSVEAKIFTGTFIADDSGMQDIRNWLYEGADHNGGNSGSQVNAIQLRSIPLSTPKTWSGTVNGTWDTTTANFTGFAFVAGDNVTFGDFDAGGTVPPVTRNITIQAGGVTPGLTMTVNNSSGDYTFTGSINGANQTVLIKDGTGAATLAGTTDNPGLAATVNAGTLLLGKTSSATVHAVASVTVGAGGTVRLTGTGGDQIADNGLLAVSGRFELNGNSEAVNGLTGASTGVITNGGTTPVTLTVGASNGAGGFAGVISDGPTAATALVKAGTAAQSLTGANTFTGGTTVNAGTLSLGFGGNNGTLAPGSVVTVNANATLRFTVSDALGFNAGSTAPVTVNGGVMTSDAGIHQTLSGVTLNGGTLTAIGAGDAGLNFGNYIIDGAIISQASPNVSTVNAQGIVLRGNPTGGGADAPVTFNVARGSGPVDLAVSSSIEDTGRGLIKAGAGIAVFSAPSAYTGPTVISAGLLSVANNGALGTGPVSLTGGALQLAGRTAAIGINFVGGGGPSPGGATVTGVAGVVPVANWNNISGNIGGPIGLNDSGGVLDVATLDSFTSTNTWSTGSANALLNGYLDNTDPTPNAQSVVVSGIPYGSYSVYAYFGSDGAGRTGSATLNDVTYFYSTRGNVTDYIVTTDDTGAVNPLANYALFNGVTGSSITLFQSRGSNNSGLHALEIVQSGLAPVSLVNSLNVTTNATIDVTGANAGSITGQVSIGSTQLSVTGGSNGANAAYNLSLGTVGGVSLSGSPTFNIAKNGTGDGIVTLGAITQTAPPNGITKTGDGTLILTGASAYTGATVVNSGALLVAGSLSGTSEVSVNGGGTLGGAGTITTPSAITAAAGARLAPGAQLLSPGTLSISATTLNLSAEITGNSQSLLFHLGSVAASSKVLLTAGSLNIGAGKLAFGDFQFITGNGFGEGVYTLFDTSSAIVGTLDPNPGNLTGIISFLPGTLFLGDGGRDILLNVIPEPSSLTALFGGLGILVGLGRLRRRQAAA